MKIREKKMEKREEEVRDRVCLCGCLFLLLCYTLGNEAQESKVICLACIKVRKKTAPSVTKAHSLLPVYCTLTKKETGLQKQARCHCNNQRGGRKTSHCEHPLLVSAYVGMAITWYTTKNDSHLIISGLALCLPATLPLTCGFTNTPTKRKKKWVDWLAIIK